MGGGGVLLLLLVVDECGSSRRGDGIRNGTSNTCVSSVNIDCGDFVLVVVVVGGICDVEVVFRTLMVVWRCKARRVVMVVEVSLSSVDGSTTTDGRY